MFVPEERVNQENERPAEVSFDADVAKRLASRREGRPVTPCRPPVQN